MNFDERTTAMTTYDYPVEGHGYEKEDVVMEGLLNVEREGEDVLGIFGVMCKCDGNTERCLGIFMLNFDLFLRRF